MKTTRILISSALLVAVYAALSDKALKAACAQLTKEAARKAGFTKEGMKKMTDCVEEFRFRADDEFSEAEGQERLGKAMEKFRSIGPAEDLDKVDAFKDSFLTALAKAVKLMNG